MIVVVVTVEHVADRNVETSGQFLFQPVGEIHADRVGHDDPFGGHEERRVVIIVGRAVEVSSYVFDGSARRLLGGCGKTQSEPSNTRGQK